MQPGIVGGRRPGAGIGHNVRVAARGRAFGQPAGNQGGRLGHGQGLAGDGQRAAAQGPVLASKVNVARPLPLPLEVVCSQESLAIAVQAPA